jgi:STE24 endopeptidase
MPARTDQPIERRTLAVIVDNEPGVLARVVGLFSARGYNIESLTVAETDADNFSLMAAREPDGLARALMKTVEYRAATPGALEEALFYDHPAVGNRIRNGMDWKEREIAAGRLKP